jgi:hypothetical protein
MPILVELTGRQTQDPLAAPGYTNAIKEGGGIGVPGHPCFQPCYASKAGLDIVGETRVALCIDSAC